MSSSDDRRRTVVGGDVVSCESSIAPSRWPPPTGRRARRVADRAARPTAPDCARRGRRAAPRRSPTRRPEAVARCASGSRRRSARRAAPAPTARAAHRRQMPPLVGGVAITGRSPAVRRVDEADEADRLQRQQRRLDGAIVVGDDRTPVRRLVAGEPQGVERQRIALRDGRLLLDQGGEDADLRIGERHRASLSVSPVSDLADSAERVDHRGQLGDRIEVRRRRHRIRRRRRRRGSDRRGPRRTSPHWRTRRPRSSS